MVDKALDIRDPEVQEVILSCIKSTKRAAKVFFPNRFQLPFSLGHDKIFDALDDDGLQQIVIAAPRGFGKSSIVGLAYPSKKVVFREKKFIVPISCTASQALLQSEGLKRELLSNPILVKMFGPMRSSIFSQDQWITETGTMILPRGSGQQVRGVSFGDYRPDLILVDDLEDSDTVKNEEQRRKLKEWFFADVMNSVNRARKDWKVVVIGTLLHEDSLLANLLEDTNWHPIQLELFDDNFHSSWPEFMDDAGILKLVESYRKQEMLDVLYREFRNLPVATEAAKFKASYFRYYTPEMVKELDEIVVVMDPAKTAKKASAESAAVAVGLDMKNARLLVLDIDAGQYHPDEFLDKALDLCVVFKARVLGYEETSLHEYISYPLENAMKKRGLNLELIPLPARADKEVRVSALIPFYRRGEIWHNKVACGKLEAQLLSYPRSKKWDCMDALAYIVPLLERGERYFYAKSELAHEKEYEKLEQMEDMPEPFEEDKDFGDAVLRTGGWRQC